ncbi:hypothetical protein [Staphylococcus gallinarum]|uniref:hypothetical protein n=1 Tax=Staphylococcus gallinarum TaxID=1293 RepID=UPI001E515A5B|nr:hypothetical protein [Staphylococcus gallinarum]MCD8845177.1 hypothetical protein [Staphylococcus gallinarum]
MGAFSVKKIEVSEPITMYSDLENAIEFGESFATSRIEDSEGKGYLLGGLEVSNLNESNLSEETIARLSNALEAGNISYALFPGDQRKGRLPLILDKNSRLFLETTLKELIENPHVKWYLYKLPGDIDPDNNETRGSSFVLDDEERPVVLEFKDIERYLANFGFVEEQASSNIFDTSNDEESSSDDQNPNVDETNSHDTYYENVFGDEEDETESEDASDYDDSAEDFTVMFNNDEENEKDEATFTESEKDEILDLDDEEPIVDEPNESEEIVERDQSDNNQDLKETKDIEQEEIVENASEYVALPNEVKEIINRIELPKFSDFPTDSIYKVTANTMQKEVKDANTKIANIENNIKREAIKLYRTNMANSYESIASELNTETGNEIVKNYYQTTIKDQNDLDIEFDNDVKEKESKLIDEFYGPRFENYKAEVLAKLQSWFEDEHYDEFVSEPLENYKNKRKEFYNDRKVDKLTQFNTWVKSLETTAIGKDQQQAMLAIDDYVNNQIGLAMSHINALQERLDEVNHSLTQTEYQQKANENLRETVGKNLETDEQAKLYKKERDKALEQKIKLDTQFEEFKASVEEKTRKTKEDNEKKLIDMKAQHKNEIEEYKSKQTELEKQRKAEEAKASQTTDEINKKAKTKAVKFAGIAAVASALIFGGGTALSLNGKDSDHEQKIESQQNQIEKSKDKLKEQEQQIKSKDEEIQKAKEEAKKANDSKKDKKDK